MAVSSRAVLEGEAGSAQRFPFLCFEHLVWVFQRPWHRRCNYTLVLGAGVWVMQQSGALVPAGLCWRGRRKCPHGRHRGQLDLTLNPTSLLIVNDVRDKLLLPTQGLRRGSPLGPSPRRAEKTSAGEARQGPLKEFGGSKNSGLTEPERREGGTGGKQMLNVKRSPARPEPCALGAKGHLSLSPEAWGGQVGGCPSLPARPGKATGRSQGNRCPLSAHLYLTTMRPLWAEHSEASLEDI